MKKIAIILSGGKGTRLWPLSTENHPKPLLEIFNHRTLMEETVFRSKLFADDLFILTNHEVAHSAKELTDGLGIKSDRVLIEPKDADTAAAIAFAVGHIKKIYGSSSAIVLMPVDHRIKNYGAFYRDISYAIECAKNEKSIVLFGVTPSFPATGYGYMKIGKKIDQNDRDALFEVASFHEKPNEDTAKKYLSSGDHVWNSGIYVAGISAFEQSFGIVPELQKWYRSIAGTGKAKPLPNKFKDFQFEHGIVESFGNLQSVIATFDWADIGTYDELYANAMYPDEQGNVINAHARLEDCKNCLVIGRSKKIVALGLDDIAVVDSPDGILVCKKSTHSQIVGQIVSEDNFRK